MKPTKEMIEVMQAALDGKTVQVRKNAVGNWGDWFNSSQPVWDWDTQDYRVKPQEPRRIVTYFHDGGFRPGLAFCCTNETNRILELKQSGRTDLVEFIELTPEIKSKLGL